MLKHSLSTRTGSEGTKKVCLSEDFQLLGGLQIIVNRCHPETKAEKMECLETVAKATTEQKAAEGQEASLWLGMVIGKKPAAVLSLQDIKSEDQREPASLINTAKSNL
ncbi:hypothetical protein OG21DRAFT_1525885 [Imleria badia]|nr:hypothetical protein OG21DRAFT_1525885 [Imleria badia]